jgi:hypothetical protein
MKKIKLSKNAYVLWLLIYAIIIGIGALILT